MFAQQSQQLRTTQKRDGLVVCEGISIGPIRASRNEDASRRSLLANDSTQISHGTHVDSIRVPLCLDYVFSAMDWIWIVSL